MACRIDGFDSACANSAASDSGSKPCFWLQLGDEGGDVCSRGIERLGEGSGAGCERSGQQAERTRGQDSGPAAGPRR